MELLKLLGEKGRHESDGVQTGHDVDDDNSNNHDDGVCEDVDSDDIDEQDEGTVETAHG